MQISLDRSVGGTGAAACSLLHAPTPSCLVSCALRPAAVPFLDEDSTWKAATVLAALCGAAILACLLLPVETMGRLLSRRATRTRSLVPRGSRDLPPIPGDSGEQSGEAGVSDGDQRLRDRPPHGGNCLDPEDGGAENMSPT